MASRRPAGVTPPHRVSFSKSLEKLACVGNVCILQGAGGVRCCFLSQSQVGEDLQFSTLLFS